MIDRAQAPNIRCISMSIAARWLCAVILLCVLLPPANAQTKQGDSPKKLILAHFMPWFEADQNAKRWGWHWTMNAFNPNEDVNGRRKIAAHVYPLIGPYDSGDSQVLECQLLQMKLAGIDGVIVDWYGLSNFRDYPLLHRNTKRLVEQAERLGMRFAICYEDQTINALTEVGRLKADERVSRATADINWLAENWFVSKSYVRIDDHPILLSFGNKGLTDEEWPQCISGIKFPLSYFSEHHRRKPAVGAFDWPIPTAGTDGTSQFAKRQKEWPHSIPVAYPRFVDIYAEAKLHASLGRIEDDNGKTFRTTLASALACESKIIQIATWNDWGEGTVIEPSVEFGYRDLEVLQEFRRQHVDADFSATPADLRIPAAILTLRRSAPDKAMQLDAVVKHIATGHLPDARAGMNDLEPKK